MKNLPPNMVLRSGNLFDSPVQTLVNATNIEGIMGGGIALAFKERFPKMFDEYALACSIGYHTLARPHFWKNKEDGPNVLNLATKDYIEKPSSLEAIHEGLSFVVREANKLGITSLAIPALGCGLGGLSWEDVEPIILNYAGQMSFPVEIYEPVS